MKVISKYLFVIVLSMFATISYSQEIDAHQCGTDYVYTELIKKNPEILVKQQEIREQIEALKNIMDSKSEQTYIIPVVFHVVHDYGIENISDEQIIEAVEFMNKDYALQRSDTNEIVDAFKH